MTKEYNVVINDTVITIVQDSDGVFVIPDNFKGLSSQLKPAYEPILIFQKPISEKTIASNCIKWGVGAFNIDACRVPVDMSVDDARLGGKGSWGTEKMAKTVYEGGYAGSTVTSSALGRYPTNIILDGSEAVNSLFPDSKGQMGNVKGTEESAPALNVYGDMGRVKFTKRGDNGGSAARFFYTSKVRPKERNLYVPEGMENKHPTLKPLDLLEYLLALICQPKGTILDPFMGSGSMGIAALHKGYDYVGVELQQEYYDLAKARLDNCKEAMDTK